MREIDFLPEWYKNGRRRKVNYRRQYVVLVGLVVLMAVWDLLTAGSISRARAQVSQIEQMAAQAQTALGEYTRLQSQIEQLGKKVQLLDMVDSRIDVPAVLAELSFLIGERVVLSKLDLQAEAFSTENTPASLRQSGGVIRPAGSVAPARQEPLLGGVKFKVTINGVASDVGDVAELVCRLEDSPYFFRVMPSFSRSRQIRNASDDKQSLQVSEFEITCYLANFKQEKP